jgi:hypothetical protein
MSIFPILNAFKGYKLTRSWLRIAQAYDMLNNLPFSPLDDNIPRNEKKAVIKCYLIA